MSARGSGGNGEGRRGQRIPDLWRSQEEDAGSLYWFFLERLERQGLHQRVIAAARQIRRYARRDPGPIAGEFTFFFEITALLALGKKNTAWRQFRRREELIFGRRFDLAKQKWTRAHTTYLLFHLAPFLYSAGRFAEGCALLERGLDLVFRGDSDFLLLGGELTDGTEEPPKERTRVTLDHFYRKLGKDLREWRRWKEFVAGISPAVLRLARLDRERVLRDPRRLRSLLRRLCAARVDRRTPGVRENEALEFLSVRQAFKPSLRSSPPRS